MSERVRLEKARQCLAGKKLTPREFQTLVGILDGRSIAQIAEACDVSASGSGAFYVYSGHIYKKLGLKTRTDLIDWARDRELYEDGEPNDLVPLYQPVPGSAVTGSNKGGAHPGTSKNKGPSAFDKVLDVAKPSATHFAVGGDGNDGPKEEEPPESAEAAPDAEWLSGEGGLSGSVAPPLGVPGESGGAKAPEEKRAHPGPSRPSGPARAPAASFKNSPVATVAKEDQYLTMQELQGKRVDMIVRHIGDHTQRLGRTAIKTLTFEVLNLADHDQCWIAERDLGKLRVLHNAAMISEIHFVREEEQ